MWLEIFTLVVVDGVVQEEEAVLPEAEANWPLPLRFVGNVGAVVDE